MTEPVDISAHEESDRQPDRDRLVMAIDAAASALYPATARATRLENWLPDRYLAGLSGATLGDLAERVHRSLVSPVREIVDAGGQRWRPTLIGQVISVLGGDLPRFMPILGALEIAHVGSLIVDDVEDEAPMRRGRAAAHAVHGVPTAVNAGTNAYLAMDWAIRQAAPDDPLLRGRLYEVYVQALRSAHAGQALDIQGHRREMDRAVACGDAVPLLETVRLAHQLKSGVMVGAVFEMAAVFAGADAILCRVLADFGSAVGTAYQITDDAADLYGITRNGIPTKRAAEDLHNGKVTMPLAHAVRLLPAERMQALWAIVRSGAATQEDVQDVVYVLNECGALDACEAEAHDLLQQAWEMLSPMLPADGDQLRDSARQYIDRSLLV